MKRLIQLCIMAIILLVGGVHIAFANNFTLEDTWHHLTPGYTTYSVKGDFNDTLTFTWSRDSGDTKVTITSSKKDKAGFVLPYVAGLSMVPYDFYIKELKDLDTGKRFWIITAREGNKVIGYGFWIIGEYKGKYIIYVSENSLNSMGWVRPPQQPTRNYINVVNGNLYIRMTKVFVDRNLPGYKTWTNYDPVTVRLFWDPKANWFGMESSGNDIQPLETRVY